MNLWQPLQKKQPTESNYLDCHILCKLQLSRLQREPHVEHVTVNQSWIHGPPWSGTIRSSMAAAEEPAEAGQTHPWLSLPSGFPGAVVQFGNNPNSEWAVPALRTYLNISFLLNAELLQSSPLCRPFTYTRYKRNFFTKITFDNSHLT